MAFDRLIDNIIEKQNPTVAGLDPKLDYVPASIKDACFAQYGKTLEGAAAALLAFNKAIIDQIYDIVPAVKPPAAEKEPPFGLKVSVNVFAVQAAVMVVFAVMLTVPLLV